jgi:hypothetical protein
MEYLGVKELNSVVLDQVAEKKRFKAIIQSRCLHTIAAPGLPKPTVGSGKEVEFYSATGKTMEGAENSAAVLALQHFEGILWRTSYLKTRKEQKLWLKENRKHGT